VPKHFDHRKESIPSHLGKELCENVTLLNPNRIKINPAKILFISSNSSKKFLESQVRESVGIYLDLDRYK